MQTLGDLFENLCVRDLGTYLSTYPGLGNRMSYYRDDKGLEVDIVLEKGTAWAGIEVKLSEAKVDQAAENLLRLREKITRNKAARVPEPAFLAVVVGAGNLAYRRPDGVFVLPIATLAP
jgi:predicted AAA+ superfamily ATPase